MINSPVYLATFRVLGANPVAMDPSELYLAPSKAWSTASSIRCPTSSRNDVRGVKFVSLDRHTTDFFIVSTNNKCGNGIAPRSRPG